MKTILICVLLFLGSVLHIHAYEPPKGITWDMTVMEIDSILGVKFTSRDREIGSKPEVLELYYTSDLEDNDVREKLRNAFQIKIKETDVDRITLRINVESNKLECFEMGLISTAWETPCPMEQALLSKYGKPSIILSKYKYVWKDIDGSEITFENKMRPGYGFVRYYMFVTYASPEYHILKKRQEIAKGKRK